jgi:hypothetical protein
MFAACGGGNDESGSGNAPTSGGGSETTTTAQEEATQEVEPEAEETIISMEEMLSNAEIFSFNEFRTSLSNVVRAEQTYSGNNFTVTGRIGNIQRDHLVIVGDAEGGRTVNVQVYFNDESILATFDTRNVITVVGEITKVEVNNSTNLPTATMVNAYFVNDIYQVTVTPFFRNDGVQVTNVVQSNSSIGVIDNGYQIKVPSEIITGRERGEMFVLEGRILRNSVAGWDARNDCLWEMIEPQLIEP